MENKTLGIYIHVPFCKSKCPYCDFYSIAPVKTESYVQKVCAELEHWGSSTNKTVDTIYFGGGTPSLLDCGSVCRILSCVKSNFRVLGAEVTIEINPADYRLIDFEKLKSYGVNRISVGAQSINDSELKILGRRHDSKDIFNTYAQIKASGINNISFDAMLGIPEQTEKSINDFLAFCHESKIPHVSAYLLKIEKGTPFYKNQKNLGFPTDDESAEIYAHICDTLKNFGYNHYEISNFARPGFESRHNLKYWNLDEYLGIGPSAHSLINDKRFYYPNSFEDFITDSGVLSEGNFEPEKEYAMLQLRLSKGLEHCSYKNKFDKDIPESYFKRAQKYINSGFAMVSSSGLRLTEKGFLVSNHIISDMLW